MPQFPDLTIASTIHNNIERWLEMATSFEQEAGFPLEIVAVDDASATPAAIAGLRTPVRLLRNEKARGFGGASDQALKAVTTPYALLLDADITFLPGDFAAAFAAFKADPQLAWSNFQQVSQHGIPGGSTEEIIPPGYIYALGNQIAQRWVHARELRLPAPPAGARIKYVPIAHSSSAFVRLAPFREIGGFDPRFWQCQSDNDVCLRLAGAGWKVGVDLSYTVRHDGIGGRTGGTSRVYDLYRGKLLIYETHRPLTRWYLRPLLAVRHALEGIVALFSKSNDPHRQASFRWRLALGALRGYPN